ncbi:MAG: DUF3288 family protein [Cyanobacteria bacterium P01_A01_bin.135]
MSTRPATYVTRTMADKQDQQHPQYSRDRDIVSALKQQKTPSEHNLAELARLYIRYQDFPGARDIQSDLAQLLKTWQLTEGSLFEQTRRIHQQGQVYRNVSAKREDWS